VKAEEVRRSLMVKWPPAEYLHVEEAPLTADRQGRKLDVLILSTWGSRGFEREGVEVKVSVSDWKRELAQAAKADGWWRKVHRFWIAVPEAIAAKVQLDLPRGWGLLACSPEACNVVVKAERHEAEALGWGACIGLMRAAADAGPNALFAADQKGYQRGFETGRREGERRSGDLALRSALDELRAAVETFEKASGLTVRSKWEAESSGHLAALIMRFVRDPQMFVEGLARQAADLAKTAEALRGLSKDLRAEIATPLPAGVAS
jgi:hypothetical protein